MDTSLKVGLGFQILQIVLLGLVGAIAGIMWLISVIEITAIGIVVFMWVCLNIASLIMIGIGVARQGNTKQR